MPAILLALLGVATTVGVALVASAQGAPGPQNGPPIWSQSLDQPTSSALVRHLAVDPRTCDRRHDVWVVHGASPGPAARVARPSVR